MSPSSLMPRQRVPVLELPLTDGRNYCLQKSAAPNFDLLVFYRGLHCPICAKYLLELERLVPEFEQRGVEVVAISSDTAERARAMSDKLGLSKVRVAHSLPLASARDWGLYISAGRGMTSIGIEEPALFSEPGVFLVRPDATLYYGSTQTMPFTRPPLAELLMAVDFALNKSYPARGEYDGTV